MGKNSREFGSTKQAQTYKPPITRHRKEIGDHVRKRTHKPMVSELNSKSRVKKFKSTVNKMAIYLPIAICLLLLGIYIALNFELGTMLNSSIQFLRFLGSFIG